MINVETLQNLPKGISYLDDYIVHNKGLYIDISKNSISLAKLAKGKWIMYYVIDDDIFKDFCNYFSIKPYTFYITSDNIKYATIPYYSYYSERTDYSYPVEPNVFVNKERLVYSHNECTYYFDYYDKCIFYHHCDLYNSLYVGDYLQSEILAISIDNMNEVAYKLVTNMCSIVTSNYMVDKIIIVFDYHVFEWNNQSFEEYQKDFIDHKSNFNEFITNRSIKDYVRDHFKDRCQIPIKSTNSN